MTVCDFTCEWVLLPVGDIYKYNINTISSSLARRRLPPDRWPPDEGSPGRRSRLSMTLTGAASPPRQALGRHPQRPAGTPSVQPPPPLRPAGVALAQPAGAGGRTPLSWHQLGEKRKS